VIDTATNAVTATIPVGEFAQGVAVTPDGSKVYVANGSNIVSVAQRAPTKQSSWACGCAAAKS
jgi:DNA-binding beta-propeller fold protein YncE